MTPLIDTHCHLDAPPLGDDVEAVLARARAAGVTRVIVPAVSPRGWSTLAALRDAHPNEVAIALGVHPQCLSECADAEREEALATLEVQAQRLGAVAIGECGLDGAVARVQGVSLEDQARLVRRQAEIAERLALPLIVHTHGAMGASLALFEALGPRRHGAVLHAFGGPAALVARWAALGFSFGIGPSITRPQARRPKEAARGVPLDRLLLETDGPDAYVASAPSRVGEPAQVAHVLAALAALREEPLETLARASTAAAARLFGPW